MTKPKHFVKQCFLSLISILFNFIRCQNELNVQNQHLFYFIPKQNMNTIVRCGDNCFSYRRKKDTFSFILNNEIALRVILVKKQTIGTLCVTSVQRHVRFMSRLAIAPSWSRDKPDDHGNAPKKR